MADIKAVLSMAIVLKWLIAIIKSPRYTGGD